MLPAARPHALGYGGVAFSITSVGEAPSLPEDYGPYVGPADAEPTAARVECVVAQDSRLRASHLNHADFEDSQKGFSLRGDYASADVDMAGSVATASARVAPEPMGWAALLRFMSAGIIERVGGLSLHAAGVVVGGRAVLLIGPSGAGKSTACDLCRDALTFAYDQVVVYPDPDDRSGTGYRAWALPWGQASKRPRTSARSLPLAACLRVTRGTPTTEARLADPVQGMFELRRATSVNERSTAAEDRRLSTLAALAAQVPVGFLSTVLGEPADGAIADLLHQASARPMSLPTRPTPGADL